MFFRHKLVRLSGFILLIALITLHPVYAAWWDRNAIPLPGGSEEAFQETRNISGSEFVFKYYTSSQDAKSISDFFRSKLPALDWKEKELLKEMSQVPGLKIPGSVESMLAMNSIFEKEGEIIMINFLPEGVIHDGKTRFTIARGKMETKKAPGEDDFIPRLAGKPKADVAPAYPGAALISLSENTGFMRAVYFSKDNIGKVSEFYKDKMANYGWSLKEEKPLKKLDSDEADISKLCPDCPTDNQVSQAIKPVGMTVRELDFSNQQGDLCIIALTEAGPKQADEGNKLANTTTIMVQYEKAGK